MKTFADIADARRFAVGYSRTNCALPAGAALKISACITVNGRTFWARGAGELEAGECPAAQLLTTFPAGEDVT